MPNLPSKLELYIISLPQNRRFNKKIRRNVHFIDYINVLKLKKKIATLYNTCLQIRIIPLKLSKI